MKCILCNRPTKGELCKRHESKYMFDKSINGYRLKKRNSGSRYIQARFHNTETMLIKILEHKFGKANIVVSYHPMWAISDKNVLLEYDIYIPSKKLLIEYNGRQHYEYIKFFHKTRKKFKAQQDRDKLKARLAKKHGLKLLVFSYNEPILKDYVLASVKERLL